MMRLDVNWQQLKLFYYVAKFGGISKAATRMPERMERSALSKQMTQLENDLGFKIFVRQPFQATPEGERVFGFVKPLMEEFPLAVAEMRGTANNCVRIGAAPVVLREYLPVMVQQLEQRFPHIDLEYNEGLQWQIEEWFNDDMLDLAVTMLDGKPPADAHCEPLLRLPMVLLVPQTSALRSAKQIWQSRPIQHRLICPRISDAITRNFQQGLRERKIDWPSHRTANSIEMAESHVKKGLGVAVSLAIPGRPFAEGLRALPLRGFPAVRVGMIWKPHPNAATLALMELLREQARQMAELARRKR